MNKYFFQGDKMENGYDGFYADVWEVNKTKVISIDFKVAVANNIKKGDRIKVWVKKVPEN